MEKVVAIGVVAGHSVNVDGAMGTSFLNGPATVIIMQWMQMTCVARLMDQTGKVQLLLETMVVPEMHSSQDHSVVDVYGDAAGQDAKRIPIPSDQRKPLGGEPIPK